MAAGTTCRLCALIGARFSNRIRPRRLQPRAGSRSFQVPHAATKGRFNRLIRSYNCLMAVAAVITADEYLRRERESDEKHEFLAREIEPMPGVTQRHSLIATDFRTTARGALRPRGCNVYDSDLKVRIPGDGYLYPDASLVCSPLFEGEREDILLNPQVVVEVLISGTGFRDRTTKFDAYTLIDSVQEIILIETESRHVSVYQRKLEGWLLNWAHGQESFKIPSLGVEIALDDIYGELPATSTLDSD